MAITKILDRLYLGNAMDTNDVEMLRLKGIRFVLNCAGEFDYSLPPDFVLEKLTLDDMYAADMEEVGKGMTFIANSIVKGKVLVHCKVGISRSPAVIISYLYLCGFGLDEALKMVESANLAVKPNPQIMMELQNMEKELYNQCRRTPE